MVRLVIPTLGYVNSSVRGPQSPIGGGENEVDTVNEGKCLI